MDKALTKAAVASIEEELKVVKAQLEEFPKKEKNSFISLKGLWKGKSNFSYDEIKQAEIKLKENI